MFDFLKISTKSIKKDVVEIYPKFIVGRTQDLLIRGGDFYAAWIESKGLWSTDEWDVIQAIDAELKRYYEDYKNRVEGDVRVKYLWDSSSGMIDVWHKYCQKQMRDTYKVLDENIVFANTEVTKSDYASKKLPYALEKGSYDAYDKIISTLYSESERHKIEWAIGSIVTGDSKKLQKFIVLYGSHGTGKSTIINIIQQLFTGYTTMFNAKDLGTANNQFSLEPFKNNPMVAIQHDGDLSRIEDNTRLNSLISHEAMPVNEKHKSIYQSAFKSFLIMGTNKPVKITDSRSGIIRRLIDVSPTGRLLARKDYRELMDRVKFELGAIAYHCMEVYLEDPEAYDDYIPITMLDATNDFYNFMSECYLLFKKDDGISLKTAWELYKNFNDEANVPYPYTQRVFKEELKNYFKEYQERYTLPDGTRARSYFKGFITDRFEEWRKTEKVKIEKDDIPTIKFEKTESLFDKTYSDCLAQYATNDGTPTKKWSNVKETLLSLDTSKLHYVKVPENHIVIDFDLKDKSGTKSLELNVEAANKWPKTYSEVSRSGNGVHLHYIYDGDVTKLSRIYDNNIEVKVYTGNSSLRRQLTLCTTDEIAHISEGILPLKGADKMINFEGFKNEAALRTLIKRNLNKEIHNATAPSVNFIFKILEDAYESGMTYDVSDIRQSIIAFAANSTNQSDVCLKLVGGMKFHSEEPSINDEDYIVSDELAFYDIEVFPNLLLVNWKFQGKDKKMVRLINPSPYEIEKLVKLKLVGHNVRRYDNHILYARMLGYDNQQIYELSQRIVNGDKDAMFREAYNISYTDTYDFASAANKMSLKALQVKMGIHHQELGLPWDKPVPENMWPKVSEYCDNDVYSTEEAFEFLKADWIAREILASLTGMTVNDTTNALSTKLIFKDNRKPQSSFKYRNLAEPVFELSEDEIEFLKKVAPGMMKQRHGEAQSLLPYFPGYKKEWGKSTYRGIEVGEGGYVYHKPGMYSNVALLDVASMHPHSLITELLLGLKYTTIYYQLVEARVAIKHEDWKALETILDGKLMPYVAKVQSGELSSKDLSTALKTAINSVYGLTCTAYENAFRDKRNHDNIVAKRGALFMVDLLKACEGRGMNVIHIKTDSIKIADATQEQIDFISEFGSRYGYTFEHEDTYDRLCLVNKSTYIAKYMTPHKDKKTGEDIWWTATGKQFQVPYVFKTLFTGQPITFEDLCDVKQVRTAIYLDMNEKLQDDTDLVKQLAKLRRQLDKGQITQEFYDAEKERIEVEIETCHDRVFVGKVGQFCPMVSGVNAGILLAERHGKYDAVNGTKGYRWMESEMVTELGLEDRIDKSYFINLANEAVEAISEYGDFEWFRSIDPYPREENYEEVMLGENPF